MMQAVTDNQHLAEGMRLIEELYNAKRQVHRLSVLMQAIDNTAQREEEARRAEAERRAADEQAEHDRLLNEGLAHYEQVLNRDYRNDYYLRKLYGPWQPGTRRPGTRRTYD